MSLARWMIITSVSIFLMGGVFAEQKDDPYFRIKSISVEEITNSSSAINDKSDLRLSSVNDEIPTDKIGEVIQIANDLIALGEKIYEIVKKCAPVVNVDYAPISVLPVANKAPVNILDTENWSLPMSKKYKLTLYNTYNMRVVNFVYSVNFLYGGSYDGHGKYLNAVQIVPEYVKVAPMFKFSASFKLVGIANHGTKLDPVAGATLMISYRTQNVVVDVQENLSYHITGDGSLYKL